MCYRFTPLSLEKVQEALVNLRRCGRATFGGRGGGADGVSNSGGASGVLAGGVLAGSIPAANIPSGARDAYPGAQVPVIVRSGEAAAGGGGTRAVDPHLQAAVLTWGFQAPRPRTNRDVPPGAGDRTGGGNRPGGGADARRDTQLGRTLGADATLGAGFSATAPSSSGKLVFNTRLDTAVRQLREGRGMWAQAVAQGRCLVPARAFYEQGAVSTGVSGTTSARMPWRFSPVGSSVFLLAGVAQDGRFSIVTTEPNAQVAAVHNRMPLALGPGESSAWLAGDFDRLADRSAIRLDVRPNGEAPLDEG